MAGQQGELKIKPRKHRKLGRLIRVHEMVFPSSLESRADVCIQTIGAHAHTLPQLARPDLLTHPTPRTEFVLQLKKLSLSWLSCSVLWTVCQHVPLDHIAMSPGRENLPANTCTGKSC